MEMTTELTAFSSAPVDAAKLNVPDGFKQVEHEMKKALKERAPGRLPTKPILLALMIAALGLAVPIANRRPRPQNRRRLRVAWINAVKAMS